MNREVQAVKDVAFKLRILWWNLLEAYATWRAEVWRRDLDQHYCCSGDAYSECACGGMTVREAWSIGHEPAK